MTSVFDNITVPCDLKKTYGVAEQYPEFVDFYSSKEITYEDATRSVVKIKSTFFGIPFSWEGKSIKEKYKRITWTQSKGLLKSMRADWLFFDLVGRTRVTLTATYHSRIPFWENIAMALFVRTTLPKILNCLKIACDRS